MRVGIAVLCVALAGCGAAAPAPRASPADDPFHDLLVTPAQCEQPSASAVTPRQMAADWRVLVRVLRRGWAGWGVAGEAAAFAALRDRGTGDFGERALSTSEFVDRIAGRLSFVRDNHLALWARGRDGRIERRRPGATHASAFAGEVALERRDGLFVDARGNTWLGCDASGVRAPFRPTIRGEPPRRRWVPTLLEAGAEPGPALDCTLRGGDGRVRSRAVGLRPLDLSSNEGPAFERGEIAPGIPWLRLRTLWSAHRAALERFVAAGPEVRGAPVVVLDLRGNGGGDDGFVRDFFLSLGSRELSYFASRRVHSEVTLQGDVSFWRCQLERAERRGAGGAGGRSLAWMRGRLARAERVLEAQARARGAPFRTVFERRTRTPGTAPGPFEGRLLLVVDDRCASACEAAVMYARQFPGTVVVGENTAGVDAFTEVRRYRLPHSGIFVEAGVKELSEPHLGCFPEGVGYLPDLWLGGEELEQAPISTIVARLAHCLAEEDCAQRALPPEDAHPSLPAPGWLCSASTSPP